MQVPGEDDPDALVPAVLAETVFEAQTKAAVLEEAGLKAVVYSGEASWIGAANNPLSGGRVPVLVKRADVDRARALLEQTVADSVDIDWSEVDVGEPEPETRFVRRGGLLLFLGAIALIVITLILLRLLFD